VLHRPAKADLCKAGIVAVPTATHEHPQWVWLRLLVGPRARVVRIPRPPTDFWGRLAEL